MSRSKVYLLTGMLSLAILFACGPDYNFDKKFSTVPEKPKSGEEITVLFNSTDTKLADSDKIDAVFYQFSNNIDKTTAVPMKKEDGGWIAKFKPEEGSLGAVVKFKSGDTEDSNEGNGYFITMHNEEGNVVPGYKAGLATGYYSWIRSAGVEPDREIARKMFEEEFGENPQVKPDYLSLYLSVVQRVDPEAIAEVTSIALGELKEKEELTEKDLELLAGRTEVEEERQKYEEMLLEKYPEGDYAQGLKYQAFREAESLDDKMKIAEEYAAQFPDGKYIEGMYFGILRSQLDAGEYSDAKDFILGNTEKINEYYFYYAVNRILEGDENPEAALAIAEKGVEKANAELKNPSEELPSTMTEEEWKTSREYYAGLNYFGLGNAQYKLGKLNEAKMNLSNAVNLTEDYYLEQDLAALYVNVLMEANDYQAAMGAIDNFFKTGNATEEMKVHLKTAYAEVKGDSGFEEYLAALESKAESELISDLKKEMIEEPAPQFTLTDVDGKEVSLADYKGKAVIVDFWATWCGPCLNSFPGMKKAVEKFSDDENVHFLFVNTWENVDDKVKNAKDFITNNNYPFHVLMDTENKVVTDFKVSGIPTKFIIDGNGNIRFKSVGFGGNTDHLVDELSAMISMIN